MSLDDTVNLGRIASAFEKIALALADSNIIEREKLAREFPLEKERRAAEVIRPDEDKRAQFNDHASPEWLKETEDAAGPSRFQTRLESQKSPKSTVPARGRTAPVPKTQ
jgi:hypothetical protein